MSWRSSDSAQHEHHKSIDGDVDTEHVQPNEFRRLCRNRASDAGGEGAKHVTSEQVFLHGRSDQSHPHRILANTLQGDTIG